MLQATVTTVDLHETRALSEEPSNNEDCKTYAGGRHLEIPVFFLIGHQWLHLIQKQSIARVIGTSRMRASSTGDTEVARPIMMMGNN